MYHTLYITVIHSICSNVGRLSSANCGTRKPKKCISELRIPFLSNVWRHFMYCQRSAHTMTSTMPIVVSNLRQPIVIRQLSDIGFCKLHYALFWTLQPLWREQVPATKSQPTKAALPRNVFVRYKHSTHTHTHIHTRTHRCIFLTYDEWMDVG